jgi:hypothetical protein
MHCRHTSSEGRLLYRAVYQMMMQRASRAGLVSLHRTQPSCEAGEVRGVPAAERPSKLCASNAGRGEEHTLLGHG